VNTQTLAVPCTVVADQFAFDEGDPDEWLHATRRDEAIDARRTRADERAIQGDEATLLALCHSARLDHQVVQLTTASGTRSGTLSEVSQHFVVLKVVGQLIMTPTRALRAVSSTRALTPGPVPLSDRTLRQWLDDIVIDRPDVQLRCGSELFVGTMEWVGVDLIALRIRRGDQRAWVYASAASFDELTMASG
jgi:hypothetical protein